MTPKKKKLIGIIFGFALLAFWQLLAMYIGKKYILPSPVDVVNSIIENRIELFTVHLPATMIVVAIGCVFSLLIGFALALFMDFDKRIEKAIYPLLTITQTIPVICIAPIFVLWFGYSTTMRVIVVILVNFFSVAINVFDGFKSTNKEHMELLETFGAGRMQKFFYLRTPTALPNFFTSLKVCIPWSVIGAAVAEWLGAPSGLGTFSRSCMMNLNAAGLLAPIVILTAIALILNNIVKIFEKKIVTWKGEA